MNHLNPAYARTYGPTMRGLLLAVMALVALLILAVATSCSSPFAPKSLPFDFGVRYQIEQGLFLVATPKDKGGMDLKFEGDGQLNDHLTFDGAAWTYTSPRTGAIYRITQGPTGRPKIEIVGGGSGRLQIVPKAEPVPKDPPA